MTSKINENTQYIDEATGKLINNGFIYIGSNNLDAKLNPVTIYSDRALSVVLPNPQRTGSDGRAVNKIWVSGQYSLIVEDSDNVQKLSELSLGVSDVTGNITLIDVIGSNTITANASPTILSLMDNQIYIFTAAGTNSSAVTLKIGTLTAYPVKKRHDVELDSGDIELNQSIVVIWNETDLAFEMVSTSDAALTATPSEINAICTGRSLTSSDDKIDNFPAGTLMVFQQTAAPTGWTKQTTHDNKAFRVVSGTTGSGGSVAFTTAFASQAVSGTNSGTALSIAQMPSHNHLHGIRGGGGAPIPEFYGSNTVSSAVGTQSVAAQTSQPFTSSTGSGTTHTHTFSGTSIDLAVSYVDLIISSKD